VNEYWTVPEHHRVWLYTPSRGWGYTFRVPCVVVGSGRARKKIAVLTESCVLKTRFVDQNNLTRPASDSEAAKCQTVQNHWDERASVTDPAATTPDERG
jgi:hypothetical protein